MLYLNGTEVKVEVENDRVSEEVGIEFDDNMVANISSDKQSDHGFA